MHDSRLLRDRNVLSRAGVEGAIVARDTDYRLFFWGGGGTKVYVCWTNSNGCNDKIEPMATTKGC